MAMSGGVGAWELLAPPGPEVSVGAIRACLVMLRRHLDMDIAYVSRFRRRKRVFEYVESRTPSCAVRPGHGDPIGRTLCGLVAEGRLPMLMPDVQAVPEAKALPTPGGVPVGALVCVPLRAPDGTVVGSLGCLSHEPDPTLRERDLDLVSMVAGVVERHLMALMAGDEVFDRQRLVEKVLRDGGPRIAVQPVVHLPAREPAWHEALARFPALADWETARWFLEAEMLGVGHLLEACAVESALRNLPHLPAGSKLAVHVSATALLHPEVVELLTGEHASRLIVGLTERHRIEDLDDLSDPLAELRGAGALLALDEAGSGWAGLQHVERLEPDVLRLHRSLVTGIGSCPARQAMAEAVIALAHRVGAEVVGIGVEDERDLKMLVELGVEYAQGHLLGSPTYLL